MSFKTIDDSFFSLIQDLKTNGKIEVESYKYPSPANTKDKKILDGSNLPGSIKKFITELNGFYLRWNVKDESIDCRGRLKILSISQLFAERKGVVYFDESNSKLKNFFPIDFFADEACSGVYAGSNDDSLYYYQFSSSEQPQRLGLNITDYVQAAISINCYAYWPLILLLYAEEKEHPMVADFQKNMQILFKGFDISGWFDKFSGK